MKNDKIEVVVGVIFNADRNRVLLSRRKADADQGGLWEFPGGKCDEGEDKTSALKRELHEELGMQVEAHETLLEFDYDYPHKSIRFTVSAVYAWDGDPYAREGQKIEWVSIEKLGERDFPAANVKILESLSTTSTSG